MFLILEVVSENAGTLGPASRVIFTAAGGSIGRRPGNDWVLPDPHVSGRHARVRSIGGTFFIEDNESANGIRVNGNHLHPGEPFPLKDGDAVLIDPFEMSVHVSMTRPAAAIETAGRHAESLPLMSSALPEPPLLPPDSRGLLAVPMTESVGFDDLLPDAGRVISGELNPALESCATTPKPDGRADSAIASAAGEDFASLLRGAGVPAKTLSPEVMAEFGQVLRLVIEGLMEVLRARVEIRNEFRLPQTTFKTRDNNPLKMAVNAEDAIHNLLVKRNPAYLGTAAAFDDALKDVRHHQVAMLVGMRAAFEFMLQRFDPETLKGQFDARPGRRGLSFGSHGRYWEAFEEFYKEITADGNDCFRRLFGDQFGRAYEEQIQLLRSARQRRRS